MPRSAAPLGRREPVIDRLARAAERLLRLAGDPRLALVVLLATGAWNAAAAATPGGASSLSSPWYAALLGLLLVTGLAALAVRAPVAWREWRHPAPPPEGEGALATELAGAGPPDAEQRGRILDTLRAAGYRPAESGQGARWGVAGVRRGWSRFAALLSHLALVALVAGAGVGQAFASETTFSLLPGDQALLDAPAPGFTDAVRLDRFDPAFGPDGRPLRLDAYVTFLRDGVPAASQLVQVNQPGTFGDYLLHAWTYGPAARVRVTSLGGRPLLDGAVALDGSIDGRPAALVELPAAGLSVGLVLLDAQQNRLAVSAAGDAGVIDAAELTPAQERRIGPLIIRLEGFDAYLTFLSRRDPGMGLVFAGAGLLSLSLIGALWLPRRRVGLRPTAGGLRLTLRGERFDLPHAELEALRERLAAIVGAPDEAARAGEASEGAA